METTVLVSLNLWTLIRNDEKKIMSLVEYKTNSADQLVIN